VTREKVLATLVELLQTTLIRVGNEEYARDNGAYGLTTLRNRHARVSGADITFVFTGKSGLRHEVHAQDRRVARVLRQCQEIPGQRLFQYLDAGNNAVAVHSHDVNDYLREAAGADITAKDFRTWVATVSAAGALGPSGPAGIGAGGASHGPRGRRHRRRRPRQHRGRVPRVVHPSPSVDVLRHRRAP
jgi:DNA topoisomerase I